MELKRALPLVLACACAGPQSRRLIVPEDMRSQAGAAEHAARSEKPAKDPFADAGLTVDPFAAPTPVSRTPSSAKPSGSQPAAAGKQRYVLRMVEHGRIWEVELPETSGGYEVRIPLAKPEEMPTAADDEMLGKHPPAPTARSYLGSLARVSEMYAAHRYELALIELVDLEQQYPKEPRIPAMKGSLYQKLGKATLARDAWKKALELDPNDTAVAEALRGLKEE